MRRCDPIKQILSRTQPHWDHDERRPVVRWAFGRALQCRTAALGGEVFGSPNEERIFHHTCKSRACSSCGYRNTVQWQRERWAALPDVLYKGVTFTMPNVLWPFFRDNPHLAKALAKLAARVLEARVSVKYGVRVGVMAILHTFNGELEFNSHVHTMVTGGGLSISSGTWVARVYFDRDRLMEAWRNAVVRLLRAALQVGTLHTNLSFDQVETLLAQQEVRWWSIKIQSFNSRERFLRYAGRYVRRPPVARHRITHRRTSAAIFAILGQERRPRPKPRRWADSLKRDFGHDPLLDCTGKTMKWLRRISPEARR